VFPNSSQWCSQFVAQVLMCSPSCSQQHHTLSYIIIPCPKFYPLTKIAKPRGKRLHTLPIWGVSIVRVCFFGDGPIIWAHHPQQNQVVVFMKEPMFHLPVLWIFLLKKLENHNYIPKISYNYGSQVFLIKIINFESWWGKWEYIYIYMPGLITGAHPSLMLRTAPHTHIKVFRV